MAMGKRSSRFRLRCHRRTAAAGRICKIAATTCTLSGLGTSSLKTLGDALDSISSNQFRRSLSGTKSQIPLMASSRFRSATGQHLIIAKSDLLRRHSDEWFAVFIQKKENAHLATS